MVSRAVLPAAGGPVQRRHLGLDDAGAPRPPPGAPAATAPRPRDRSRITAPVAALAEAPPRTGDDGTLGDELRALERARILDALERAGDNQTRAAQALGISRGTLIARLTAYGIARPRK